MSKFPEWMNPMLATLYKSAPFDDPDWIFERKLDGVRCFVYSDGEEVRLMTRNKNKVNHEYPEIAGEVGKLSDKPFVIDGEIVVGMGKMGSFSKMQNRMGVKNPSDDLLKKYPLYYYVFDILYLDGSDLREKPLEERKKALKKMHFTNRVKYTTHHNESGIAFMKKMRDENYEGSIAKKRKSKYLSSRSKKWLKLKCLNEQELVIGGYTDPRGERVGFGALLVGFYADEDFVYAGKVGTGYSEQELKDLHEKLKKLERKTSPYDKNSPDEDGVHWVTPKLVAEVKFTEWTDDNKLRHPAYLGLRRDKDPKKVVKEG